MTEYKIATTYMKWYGGDNGYGTDVLSANIAEDFENDQEALAWAYRYASENSVLRHGKGSTPSDVYDVRVVSNEHTTADGKPVLYDVQYVRKYRAWFVFTRFDNDEVTRGYRLHKDGTLGRWNGVC